MASYQILQYSKNSVTKWYKGKSTEYDYLGNDFKSLYVAHQQFGSEWKYVPCTNLTLGTSNIYYIDRTEGFIGNYYLEFTLPSPGATSTQTWAPLTGLQAIDFIVVRIGRDIIRYNAETLFQWLCSVNFDRTRTDLLAQTCTPSTWPTSGTLGLVAANTGCTCVVPIIAPGMLGDVKNHQIPFPIGKTKYRLEIEIYMKAASAFSTIASSVTTMTSANLRYKKYLGEFTDSVIPNIIGSGDQRVIQTHKFIDFAYDTRTYVCTAGSNQQLVVDRINRNADLIWMGLMASQNTGNDRFLGELSPQITLDILNTKFYEHYDLPQSAMMHIKTWGESELKCSTTQGRYVQTLPLCSDPMETAVTNVGMNSPNFESLKPVLMYNGPIGSSSTTYYVTLYGVYNTLLNIQADGEVAFIQTWVTPNQPPVVKEQTNSSQGKITL
jgi:hypothetical protein